MLQNRYFTLTYGAFTVIGLATTVLLGTLSLQPLPIAEPLLLSNPDGRCVGNALMQAFYALTAARGWHPERHADDKVARCWSMYEASLQQDPYVFSSINLLKSIEPLRNRSEPTKPRRAAQQEGEALTRWLQRTLPGGSEKIYLTRLEQPSEKAAVEHARMLEHAVASSIDILPEAIVVVCDYTNDPMDTWMHLSEPEEYVAQANRQLIRPQLPALLAVGDAQYRIISVVNVTNDTIPTSRAGAFIFEHAAAAWRKLEIESACHASACVRWAEQWFELNDVVRYRIRTENASGDVHIGLTLTTDTIINNRHPGVPALCIYERWNGKPLSEPNISPDSLDVIWSYVPEIAAKIRRPIFLELLHSESTLPGAPYRRFAASDKFLPA